MWIDSNFLDKVNNKLAALANGNSIDLDILNEEYKSSKYQKTLSLLEEINLRQLKRKKFVDSIPKKLNNITFGKVFVEEEEEEEEEEFNNIVSAINKQSLFVHNISDKLYALANGKFIVEEEEEEEEGLQFALNHIAKILQKLINDSNMMNKAAALGQLDIRIDEQRYKGDFATIVNGINNTMNETVLRLRDVGNNLNLLSSGQFFEEEEEEEELLYLVSPEKQNIPCI